MEKENNRIQLPLEEIKLAFAASCVEGAARKLGVPYIEIYERMRKVDLINKFILPHYDTLHTESREYLIEDVIECLTNWEKNMKLNNIELSFDNFASEMAKLKNEKHFDYLVTIIGEYNRGVDRCASRSHHR